MRSFTMIHAGDTIDRYTLLEPLGEGGQASVWKVSDALHPEIPRALKLVAVGATDATGLERVRREARALAQLSHPSIVACHALVEDLKLGYLGLVVDLVEGHTLADVADDERMTPAHREAVLVQILGALAYLHDAGIVHRDLKFANVLIASGFWKAPSEAAHVKLVDFGIAVQAGNPQPLTRLGSVVGTARYMAPELADPGLFDAPTAAPTIDVFAFGVLGWRLLSGAWPSGEERPPAKEELAALYRRALKGGTPWPAGGLDHAWADLLRQCLRLHAKERPATGKDILALRPARAVDVLGTPPGVSASESTSEFLDRRAAEGAGGSAALEATKASPVAPRGPGDGKPRNKKLAVTEDADGVGAADAPTKRQRAAPSVDLPTRRKPLRKTLTATASDDSMHPASTKRHWILLALVCGVSVIVAAYLALRG